MASFPIDSAQLIRQLGGRGAAVKYLDAQIVSGALPFPFALNYLPEPQDMFNDLQAYTAEPRTEKYTLKSYYPPVEGLFLPAQFNQQPTYLVSTESQYEEMDMLTDHYLEDVRLQTRRTNCPSVMDYWTYGGVEAGVMAVPLRQQFLYRLLKEPTIDFPTMHRVITAITCESKHFRPTWGLGLLQLLYPKSRPTILDISAGWGDRLAVCLARGSRYLGADPDEALRPGHQALIQAFGKKKDHQVIYQAFEDIPLAKLTEFAPDGFDGILTSPPFADLEIYPGPEADQSSHRYPTLNDWLVNFLFRSLQRAWSQLKNKGYLMIHMGDALSVAGNAEVKICAPMNLFIEEYLPGASWVGIIGVSGVVGSARPVWVWQKSTKPRRWDPDFPRSLSSLYPGLLGPVQQLMEETSTKIYAKRPVKSTLQLDDDESEELARPTNPAATVRLTKTPPPQRKKK